MRIGRSSSAGCGASSSPMSSTTISPQQSRATSEPRFTAPNVRLRSAITHVECMPVVASSPLGRSSAATRAPWVRIRLTLAIPAAISPRGSPAKPVPSRASMTTRAPSGALSASLTESIAACFQATAFGLFAATASTTVTSTPSRARQPATTHPSPPLLPGPVKTTAPSRSCSG